LEVQIESSTSHFVVAAAFSDFLLSDFLLALIIFRFQVAPGAFQVRFSCRSYIQSFLLADVLFDANFLFSVFFATCAFPDFFATGAFLTRLRRQTVNLVSAGEDS
jgi:hypothetical protein